MRFGRRKAVKLFNNGGEQFHAFRRRSNEQRVATDIRRDEDIRGDAGGDDLLLQGVDGDELQVGRPGGASGRAGGGSATALVSLVEALSAGLALGSARRSASGRSARRPADRGLEDVGHVLGQRIGQLEDPQLACRLPFFNIDLFKQLFDFQHVAGRGLNDQRAGADVGDDHEPSGEVGARAGGAARLRATCSATLESTLSTLSTASGPEGAARAARARSTADRLLAEERADRRLRLRRAHVLQPNDLEGRVRLDRLVQFLDQVDHRCHGFVAANEQQRIRLHKTGDGNLTLPRL